MGPEDGYGIPTHLNDVEETDEHINNKILYEEHEWEAKSGR